jgi:uncharacterized protein YndB with AHSA1/START domain
MFLAALFTGGLYNAYIVIDAAFEVEAERTLAYSPDAIWPWIYDPERRTDWQTHVIDAVPYMGDPQESESTRLLFWKLRGKRWHAVERTADVLPMRLYSTVQESDKDARWLKVELDPVSACETRVTMREVIQPKAYGERYWFFMNRSEARARLSTSLEALDRWLGDRASPCVADQSE